MARHALADDLALLTNTKTAMEPMTETTTDAFHAGAFEIVQPAKTGHRAGLDALLLAACVPESATGTLADLGAGTGAAGFAALNLNRDIDLISVELNEQMYGMLQNSVALLANHDFRARIQTLNSDVTKSGAARLKQGLNENSVDHVIMNPPYNTDRHRSPPDPTKAQAYMIGEGGIDAWFRTASAILKPGGTLSMIYRAENLSDILACSQGRFGGLEILPIHSRAEEAARRILVRSVRGSRAPLAILPGLVVHNADGEFTDKVRAIFDGEARLDF